LINKEQESKTGHVKKRVLDKTGGLPHYKTPAPNLLGRHSVDQTAGWLVSYRADLQNLRTTYKLKL
jgi:hypothetical protein